MKTKLLFFLSFIPAHFIRKKPLSGIDMDQFNLNKTSINIYEENDKLLLYHVNKDQTMDSTRDLIQYSTELPNMLERKSLLDYAATFGDILVFYYTPVVVFVGSIGNILSVFVFCCTKLKKLSSSYYLAALGISDTCFLILSFMNWLNFKEINLTNHNIMCQMYSFLQGVCSFLSVWYVVAFTVERFIAVLYPLKRQSMCTVRRAIIVLCCLTLSGCIFCTPLIYFFRPVFNHVNNSTVCDVVEEYKVSKFNYCVAL